MTEVGEAYRCGYRDGLAAARKALLVEADALAAELEDIRLQVHRLEVLAQAAPDQALHWSTH